MNTFAQKLKGAMAARGVRPIDLARACGVAPSRVTEWTDEDRSTDPKLSHAVACARALRLPLEYFADAAPGPVPDLPDDQEQLLLGAVRTAGGVGHVLGLIVGVLVGQVQPVGDDVLPAIRDLLAAIQAAPSAPSAAAGASGARVILPPPELPAAAPGPDSERRSRRGG